MPTAGLLPLSDGNHGCTYALMREPQTRFVSLQQTQEQVELMSRHMPLMSNSICLLYLGQVVVLVICMQCRKHRQVLIIYKGI